MKTENSGETTIALPMRSDEDDAERRVSISTKCEFVVWSETREEERKKKKKK